MISSDVRVLFASGPREKLADLVAAMSKVGSGELYVVSEFPPREGIWIAYHPRREWADNLARVQRKLANRVIRFAGIYLDRQMPYWELRRLALKVAPWKSWVFFTPDLNHFLLRPRSLGNILRFVKWRTKEWITFQTNPGGDAYTFLWRLAHPSHFRRPWYYRRALRAMHRRTSLQGPVVPATGDSMPEGITVVIPSRDGSELLARCLPRVLAQKPEQVVVVDNGSTEEWTPPAGVEVVRSVEALSFAAAVNRGIAQARFAQICLLNNDMEIEDRFLAELQTAFARVPGLFCATAQIFFPAGKRREETGKAVMPVEVAASDFPLACVDPIAGEDQTWVLYGSGGCSMYSTAMLRELGGFDEAYVPAYVEDLDLGYRAWQRNWPTVFVAGARVVHHHRSTTSRFFSAEKLREMVELNWLRFLARRVASPELFALLWRRAVGRLNLLAAGHEPDAVPLEVMRRASDLDFRCAASAADERLILALGSGEVASFSGVCAGEGARIVIASCYLPYPLSHGGAVRMFNLMRRAAAQGFRQTLVCFVDELAAPARELLEICERVVLVRRRGTHYRETSEDPDVVEEFRSAAFRAVLHRIRAEMAPALWQFEFTQMAQYAKEFAPAVLVEHDVTIDLYEQLVAQGGDEEVRDQLARWRVFETRGWQDCAAVVAMSEKDRARIGERAVVLANGVDVERYQPSDEEPEGGRILFIGSFNHLPNLMALDWFLREVWPHLGGRATLHVIAGQRHEYYRDFYRDRVRVELERAGVEVEGFVSDVRSAYRRAALVIAPLLASAGTNIKILEAMAMGKAIVSTPAGVNGLEDLVEGFDYRCARNGGEMAAEILELLDDPATRLALGAQARRTVESRHSWDRIAEQQRKFYSRLIGNAR